MRFAVSAFGLAMLITQFAFPVLIHAQNEDPSPLYAWPEEILQVQALQPPAALAPPAPLTPPTSPAPQVPPAPLAPPPTGRSALGAVAGAFSPAPNMVGDAFGISGPTALRQTVRARNSTATFISGGPGNLNSVLGFDANPSSGSDAVSQGPGQLRFDHAVFQVAEPTSPNILEGPDATCFTYVGGTATADSATFSGSSPQSPWDLELIYECNAIAITSAGSNVGRIKTAEDVSPIPRDRHFFNYSLFTDVPLTGEGISVNRFTLGLEEAFADDTMSVEFRLPMAVTLNSIYDVSDPDISSYEFGDLYLAAKYLFYECDNRYLSAGLSVSVPTAKDSQIFFNDALLARINNTSVRVAPFVGGLIHDDIFFAQGFIQVDVDTSGDDVFGDASMANKAGNFRDPTLLYLDLQLGAWLLRDTRPTKRDWLTGLASIFELHYNRNLDSLDEVDVMSSNTGGISRTWTIGDSEADIDVLNALAGIVLDFRSRASVAVTYGVPLTNDKQFDGELRVLLNRFL